MLGLQYCKSVARTLEEGVVQYDQCPTGYTNVVSLKNTDLVDKHQYFIQMYIFTTQ